MVREDGENYQSGAGGSTHSALPPKTKTVGIIIFYISILIIFAFVFFLISDMFVAGEYKEGVVFGSLKYAETDDSCGAWIYCYTYIEFYNQSSWRFVYPVAFVHTLEVGKIYGFYYNSVTVAPGVTGNPSFWDINLIKIVDNENNVLWKE